VDPVEVEVTFASEQEAQTAYGAGLRHGLVTTQVVPIPDEGTPCRVTLTLAHLDRAFPLLGAVVHASAVATVIRVERMPDALHELIGGEGAAPPPSPIDHPTLVQGDSPPEGEEEITSTVSLGDQADDGDAGAMAKPSPQKREARARPSGSEKAVKGWAKRLEAASRSKVKARAQRDARGNGPSRKAPAAGPALAARPTPTTRPAPTPSPTPATAGHSPAGIPVPFKQGRFLPGVALYEGTLPRHSLYQAFLQVFQTRLTGVGIIDSQRAHYWTFFLQGKPVHFLRDPPLQQASTEALLIRRKLLNEAVLDRARWLAEITARPLVSVVMRLKLIEPEQLHALRQEQTELVIKRVLGIQAGTYRFFEMPEIADVFMEAELDPVELMWRRAHFAASSLNDATLERKLAAHRGKVFERTALGQALLERLPLPEEQRGAVDRYVRTGWPANDLLERAGLATADAGKLLVALTTLGLIATTEDAGEARQQAETERNLLRRHERLRRNHFDFLEVHWSALPAEVEAACRKLEAQLREVASNQDRFPGADEMVTQLRQRLEEIRDLFRDERARAEYRGELVGVDKRRMAAELYLKQGEMALFKHEIKSARECFERLLELDPGGAGSAERQERARIAIDTIEAEDLPGPPRD